MSHTPTYNNYLSKIIRDTLSESGGTPGQASGQKGSLIYNFGDSNAEMTDPLSILRALAKKDQKQS